MIIIAAIGWIWFSNLGDKIQANVNINELTLTNSYLNSGQDNRTYNNSYIIDSSLDKTEREFFETIKEMYSCKLDDGVKCKISVANMSSTNNIYNNDNETLENIFFYQPFPSGQRILVFYKNLFSGDVPIGFCTYNGRQCSPFDNYLIANNKEYINSLTECSYVDPAVGKKFPVFSGDCKKIIEKFSINLN